jgi:uncharacterized protein (TIGR02246 family)
MKLNKKLLALMLIGLIAAPQANAEAAKKAEDNSAKAVANDNQPDSFKKSVVAALDEWKKDLTTGKASDVVENFANETILYATLANEPIKSKEELTKYFEGLQKKKDLNVTVTELNTQVFGNVAINSGLWKFSFIDEKGKQVKVPARFNVVYEKQEGKWMIVNMHSSKLPFIGL